jgi:hypothetical protein
MNYAVLLNNDLFRAAVAKQAAPQIRDAIFDLRALIIRSFGEIKSGRPGKFRRASAPGQAPAIQSGKLLRSLRERFPSPLLGELMIGAEHAEYLEMGTRFLAPRPFIAPAVESVRQRFNAGKLGSFA